MDITHNQGVKVCISNYFDIDYGLSLLLTSIWLKIIAPLTYPAYKIGCDSLYMHLSYSIVLSYKQTGMAVIWFTAKSQLLYKYILLYQDLSSKLQPAIYKYCGLSVVQI